jgi:hypothetical protein
MRDQGKSSALSGKDRARSCLLQTLQRSRNEQLLPNEAAEYVAIWTRFVIFRLYGPLLSVRTVISRLIAGITERTVRWRRDTPTSGWATSGWATPGMGDAGDGRRRGWAASGMGDAGDGRRRGWAASGMGGVGDGRRRGWATPGMGGVGGWATPGMGGVGDGRRRGWAEPVITDSRSPVYAPSSPQPPIWQR